MVEGVGVPDEQLDEWERLANEATPGPWSAADEHGLIEGAVPAWCVSRMRPGYEAMSPTGGYLYDIAYTTGTNEEPDADFIAAAREALPALLGEVRASHAREAALYAEAGEHIEAWQAAARQRDVLQERIDKALDVCDKFDPPGRLPAITFDGTPFPSAARSVRAALTGTGDTE